MSRLGYMMWPCMTDLELERTDMSEQPKPNPEPSAEAVALSAELRPHPVFGWLGAEAEIIIDRCLSDLLAERDRLQNDLADALDVKAGHGPTALSAVMAERDRLAAIVARLPVTADGVSVVSGTKLWHVDRPSEYYVAMAVCGKGFNTHIGGGRYIDHTKCYSTAEAAALAAKGASK